jgi:hypothetical protein
VEICNNRAWGTVCDDGWTATDASVVCGQLGHARDGKFTSLVFKTNDLTKLKLGIA